MSFRFWFFTQSHSQGSHGRFRDKYHQPYHDLYAFDSRVVKFLGVIKDLVVIVTKLPMKSVLMDVVIVDIANKFGMFFSRSWEKRVGGTL